MLEIPQQLWIHYRHFEYREERQGVLGAAQVVNAAFFGRRWSHKVLAINRCHVTPSSISAQACVLLSSQVVQFSCVSLEHKGVFMMRKQSLGGSGESEATPCLSSHTKTRSEAAQLVLAETFSTKQSGTKEIRCDANLFGAAWMFGSLTFCVDLISTFFCAVIYPHHMDQVHEYRPSTEMMHCISFSAQGTSAKSRVFEMLFQMWIPASHRGKRMAGVGVGGAAG